MTRQIGDGASCYVCGEDDPAILKKLEKHHIDGRSNSDIVIPICPNCHAKITNKINKISPKLRSNKNKNFLVVKGKLLVNLGALIKLVGETIIKIGYEMVEHEKNNAKSIHK